MNSSAHTNTDRPDELVGRLVYRCSFRAPAPGTTWYSASVYFSRDGASLRDQLDLNTYFRSPKAPTEIEVNATRFVARQEGHTTWLDFDPPVAVKSVHNLDPKTGCHPRVVLSYIEINPEI